MDFDFKIFLQNKVALIDQIESGDLDNNSKELVISGICETKFSAGLLKSTILIDSFKKAGIW